MSTTKKILNGLELKPYLAATKDLVKWLDSDGSILGRISAEQAIAIVLAGSYCGKVVASRVVYIRELEVVRDYTHCGDGPVMQPYSIGHPFLGSLKDQAASWDTWANAKRVAA